MKGIKFRLNARELESKGIKSGEPEKKKKGSNLGVMLENPKQKKGIESGRNAREPKTK